VALEVPGQRSPRYPPPPAPEFFWPVQVTVVGAIALQLTLPARLTVGPTWLLPALEGLLLVGLFFATPNTLEREHPRRRAAAIAMIAFVSAANVYSLGALTHFLLHHNVSKGNELIVSGMLIWLTNFVIFGLWYWELDRGGPVARVLDKTALPDFLFPQMADSRWAPDGWSPGFVDYLYVSFTNATAFSPTDAMPLSQLAKLLMTVQALASLLTIGLVVARAVNILA
jgi:uncharacterized membrane protein